jgi:hypothetical protein
MLVVGVRGRSVVPIVDLEALALAPEWPSDLCMKRLRSVGHSGAASVPTSFLADRCNMSSESHWWPDNDFGASLESSSRSQNLATTLFIAYASFATMPDHPFGVFFRDLDMPLATSTRSHFLSVNCSRSLSHAKQDEH